MGRPLIAVLLLAAACGTGTDGKPVAPPTSPAPPPAPPPEPRACTDERKRALTYLAAILPREWDGTPLRFDLFDHFPEIAGADYPERQLDEVRLLADRIEEQVGYRIIEAGDVIPVPEDMPDGWNKPRANLRCEQWRKPMWAVGLHLTEIPEGHDGGGALSAVPWCAVVSYWVGDGPGPGAYSRTAIVHELFHLLGFGHSLETNPDEAYLGGVPMSPQFTSPNRFGLSIFVPTFEDIDALRCIFPEGG